MLLGISGSLREGATNTMLIREAGRLWDGPFVEADIRFPLYDADLQDRDGIPDEVALLGRQIDDADAVVIASPEYNQSFSGVLKNALDWVSRMPIKPWAGKPVALFSAASGRTGGARGSYALRLAMTPFRTRLLPQDLLVAGARNEFDEDGRLTSERYLKQMSDILEALQVEVERGR